MQIKQETCYGQAVDVQRLDISRKGKMMRILLSTMVALILTANGIELEPFAWIIIQLI